MDQLLIPKKYAYTYECKKLDENITPTLRVFRDRPDSIQLQVRYYGSIVEGGKGTKRNMIAGVSLTPEEAKQVRDMLDDFIAKSQG